MEQINRVTVSFFGTCTALSSLVLVSRRIPYPFFTKTICANFALNTSRMLQLYFYISPDPAAPSTGKPTGIDILSSVGQVSYLVGDDEKKSIDQESECEVEGAYLKVYAVNSDTFDHTVDVQITIEPRER